MTGAARVWTVVYAGVVAAFLVMVATYYHPGKGFTAFIEFPIQNHESEIPAVRAVPHVDHEGSGGYDGQFYAQMAVEPLLADRAIDAALDTPPYRARRILMSWMSYLVGFGQPAAILHVYSLHAVVAWLVLAWLITAWVPVTSGRGVLIASTAMLAHGPMMSVRYALPDLAAGVLVACAVLSIERGRAWIGALALGAAGLTRDSSLVGGTLFASLIGRHPATWLRAAACGLLAVLPLLVWIDYVHAIYRTTTWQGSDHFVLPLSGVLWKVSSIATQIESGGLTRIVIDDAATLAAFVGQAGWLLWLALGRGDRSAWVLTGLGFLALGLVTDQAVWEGTPGAYPRVVLPMMLAARVTMARSKRGLWWLIVLAGLDIVPGL